MRKLLWIPHSIAVATFALLLLTKRIIGYLFLRITFFDSFWEPKGIDDVDALTREFAQKSKQFWKL